MLKTKKWLHEHKLKSRISLLGLFHGLFRLQKSSLGLLEFREAQGVISMNKNDKDKIVIKGKSYQKRVEEKLANTTFFDHIVTL